jgi:hypothetical protein
VRLAEHDELGVVDEQLAPFVESAVVTELAVERERSCDVV